jgi:tRNA(Arg) A34 adenosine deaminase TadA
MNTELRVAMPHWLTAFIAGRELPGNDAARLAEVLALAAENVAQGTGGPFAAAVYDEATGERLACAVNVVVAARCSLAHAETLALALAQQAVGEWSLAGRRCVLVSSAEPCAMCLGAVCWSGIARLLYAAARADVEMLGFDEGPRPARWKQALQGRGIAVLGPRQRSAARRVLASYLAGGGRVYNGGGPPPCGARQGSHCC